VFARAAAGRGEGSKREGGATHQEERRFA
jgi:hypothetical protein